MLKNVLRLLAGLGLLALAYLTLLVAPQSLFPHSISLGEVRLYSDWPIPPQAALHLDTALARLERSPWYLPGRRHRIFICQTRWRWMLFTLQKHKVGGINTAYLNRNTFLRSVNWTSGRLVGHSGKEVEGDRTLAYYLAHEMAHGITVDRIGRWRYHRTPHWIKEGYADHIAKDRWDYPGMLVKFQAGDPKMDPRSGFYWRYHLAVEYLLERRSIGLEELFQGRIPIKEVEAELLAQSPWKS